ncbi:MAG: hypothetical protein JO107_08650, partial [Hyphomicrobiales bacterium]|nr:hypothetical protein [Hyphomicrobiales bacterium]MBV8663158.1 hypothetical protein [Hyphomicrobiales bacterium]
MFRSLLASLLTLRGLIILIGLVALALVIWIVGPLVSLGDFAPLQSETNRITLIVGLFVVLAATTFVRHWLAWRANRRMIAS